MSSFPHGAANTPESATSSPERSRNRLVGLFDSCQPNSSFFTRSLVAWKSLARARQEAFQVPGAGRRAFCIVWQPQLRVLPEACREPLPSSGIWRAFVIFHDCKEVGSLGKSRAQIGRRAVKEERKAIVSSRLMMLVCHGVDYLTPVQKSIQNVQQVCLVKDGDAFFHDG